MQIRLNLIQSVQIEFEIVVVEKNAIQNILLDLQFECRRFTLKLEIIWR